MKPEPEPRNPLYLLLLIASLIFVATVLAYAIVPVLEQKAMDAGEYVPPSPFREGLKKNGAWWILGELAVIVVLGFASMGLDRYRRWQAERAAK